MTSPITDSEANSRGLDEDDRNPVYPEEPAPAEIQPAPADVQHLYPSHIEPKSTTSVPRHRKWSALAHSNILKDWSADRNSISSISGIKYLALVNDRGCAGEGWQPIEMWFENPCTESAVMKRFKKRGNDPMIMSPKPIVNLSNAGHTVWFGQESEQGKRYMILLVHDRFAGILDKNESLHEQGQVFSNIGLEHSHFLQVRLGTSGVGRNMPCSTGHYQADMLRERTHARRPFKTILETAETYDTILETGNPGYRWHAFCGAPIL